MATSAAQMNRPTGVSVGAKSNNPSKKAREYEGAIRRMERKYPGVAKAKLVFPVRDYTKNEN